MLAFSRILVLQTASFLARLDNDEVLISGAAHHLPQILNSCAAYMYHVRLLQNKFGPSVYALVENGPLAWTL
jgi:hypothetical protein